MKLPKLFEDRMRNLLEDEYDEFAGCYSKPNFGGIRANSLKVSSEELEEICPFPIKRIPWIHNGYYYCMYTGGSYDSAYGEGYAVSENIYGPYVKYENNPVLFATRCAWGNGDAAITTSPDGTKFYFAYFRHSSNTVVRPLNLCIDELKFVKNANGGADILVVRGPTVSPQPIPDFS